ncbi:MAG: hypothetical protein M1160_02295 [Candidatus Marsarchaeota archaeon]|nr:hypothetical protein [Candidatus Marsarchaeota archaeon]MCL5111690.1 hypothetical protein [Candidatus Marsarchaeota archaeon]
MCSRAYPYNHSDKCMRVPVTELVPTVYVDCKENRFKEEGKDFYVERQYGYLANEDHEARPQKEELKRNKSARGSSDGKEHNEHNGKASSNY